MQQTEFIGSKRLLGEADVIFLLTAALFVFLRVRQPNWILSTACGIPSTTLVSAYLLWQSFRDWRRRSHVYQNGVDAMADLISVERGRRISYAIVTFRLPDNSERRVKINQNIHFDIPIVWANLAKPQQLLIRYNPTAPAEAFICSSHSFWLGPLLGMISSIFLFATIFIL
ncbi:MAG: hypothetical protein R2867_03890 [Caldilineaceae bacterium]